MASIGSLRFRSESDLVTQYLMPMLREGAKALLLSDVIDHHTHPNNMQGIPDIIAEKGGKGLYLIEAKYKKKVGKIERDIEPRDPSVIKQAVQYAASNGYPWYATANAKRMILFKLERGKRPEESIVATFDFATKPDWNVDFFDYVLARKTPRLKPVDEILVETLNEAYQDLYPEFLHALHEKSRTESKFKKDYAEWLESQGLQKGNEDINRLVAKQTTYLQLNKLLFYQVIRELYPEKLLPLEIKEDEDVSRKLQQYYDDIRKIDYQPIYQTDTISRIPFTRRAKERMRTLLDTLNEFEYASLESDFLGSIYEKLIPPEERKRLGQFYTPPQIAELIISLTVKDKDNVVLDPACGSGTFLMKAYHRLRELSGIPKKSAAGLGGTYHKELLSKIYGIDINQFPAHLSVINLSIQDPKARVDRVNVILSDFFDIVAGQQTLFGFRSMDAASQEKQVHTLPYVDVVVANPPYIRQELLGIKEKNKIKEKIESSRTTSIAKDKRIYIGSGSRNAGIVLDRQSDIYIYFFIHALRMLHDNGRLGFIISNKWLEAEYGKGFQDFLLRNVVIKYVVEFDRAVFPDAEVDTCVVIVEKEDISDKRNENLVKFVRFKQPMDIELMLDRLENTQESYEDDQTRMNITRSHLINGTQRYKSVIIDLAVYIFH